jgi:hypothetical protein
VSDRAEAVQTMMGVPLGKLCEQADAVVLIFGTGCVFLRPEVDEQGNRVEDRVEIPPAEWSLDFDHPGGKQRIHGLKVKSTKPRAKKTRSPALGEPPRGPRNDDRGAGDAESHGKAGR